MRSETARCSSIDYKRREKMKREPLQQPLGNQSVHVLNDKSLKISKEAGKHIMQRKEKKGEG